MDESITLDKVIEFLEQASLFRDLDAAELAEVARIMEVARLNAGQIAFEEGEAGDAWYAIFEGSAEVLQSGKDGSSRALATLDRGSIFGEMAVLDGSPRSATVKATEPLTLFRFRRGKFDELLEQGSLAGYKLVAAMARLLSERHRHLTKRIVDLLAEDDPVAVSVRAEAGGLTARDAVSGTSGAE